MKRFGVPTIAMTLGLGLALTGFAPSASASANCPVPTGTPYKMYVQWIPSVVQLPFAPNVLQPQPIVPVYPAPVQEQPIQKPAQPVQKQPTQKPAQPAPQAPAKPAQNVAKPTAPAKQADQAQAVAFAKQVADLVNQERAKAGLAPVTMDAALSNVALAKAVDMSSNNYFDHTSPTYGSPFDMMKQFGITYMTAGENIAMGQRSPQEVMTQWMNSEGHRKNILNPAFTKIGVGYANGYWVQEFTG
ncbi:CAP domain-containing protein [Brevibacillus sp. SAFN-007a]|uniref:CAP domain-containing protein n=1 Tax=Brevibacillus sp. SAFN-007a TaxID=3436862 RepID=UPI003F81E9C3